MIKVILTLIYSTKWLMHLVGTTSMPTTTNIYKIYFLSFIRWNWSPISATGMKIIISEDERLVVVKKNIRK